MHAPTACRQTGSGSVSLPCSGFFSPFPHGTGSLSVSREYLALRDGPRCFTQNSSCSALLRIPLGFGSQSCKGLSPATVSLSRLFHLTACLPRRGPTTPLLPKQQRFGLFRVRSPLLAESQLFSLPAGTKMFQFPAFALPIRKYLVFNQVGYPIRKSPDQWSFAPTRSLSQLTTSFIASQSQGIHRSLFLSFSYAKIVVLRLTRNPSFLFTL